MIIVTYTSDHNHPFPIQKSSSSVGKPASQAATLAPATKSEKPEMAEALQRSKQGVPPELTWTEDLFADLGELEEDTMKLVFSKDLVYDKLIVEAEEEDAMDVFKRFDWVKNSSGEAK